MTTSAAFADSAEHVLGELARVDLFLMSHVRRMRALHQAGRTLDAEFISHDHVDSLFEKSLGAPLWSLRPLSSGELARLTCDIDRIDHEIRDRVEASREAGVDLRLVRLVEHHGLNGIECDVVLLCLAPEVDNSYLRIYGYLHDDASRQYLSAQLVLDLLGHAASERPSLRRILGAGGRLARSGLISFGDDAARVGGPMARPLRLDRRVADWLLGDDAFDERLRDVVELRDPYWPTQLLSNADALRRAADLARDRGGSWCEIVGEPGSGRREAAAAIASMAGVGLLVVDGSSVLDRGADHARTVTRAADLEARLRDAALYWDGFDELLRPDQRAVRDAVIGVLAHRRGLTFTGVTQSHVPPVDVLDVPYQIVPVETPSTRQRAAMWSHVFGARSHDVDVDVVAASFSLGPDGIRTAAATADDLSAGDTLDSEHVLHACRLVSRRQLARVARPVATSSDWSDLVLPVKQLEQLTELVERVKHRGTVLEDWGFGKHLHSPVGLCALFTGPSGTGKTMAASRIAGQLARDLYSVDLATVVSKYIGETEKNLSTVFAEARRSNAVLFFDEADALFGKRSEVKDAHDRYANQEVSYLLQQVEAYDGVVVLATNLRSNVDAAFLRRMAFIVEFPLPARAERREIWRRIWPDGTPRHRIDVDALAGQLEVSGGSIRNIAVAAAHFAAADGKAVDMSHVRIAAVRELEKTGRLVSPRDLELLNAEAIEPHPADTVDSLAAVTT